MTALLGLDRIIFAWINTGWTNPVFDLVMPWIGYLADPDFAWLWVIVIGLLDSWQFAHSAKLNLAGSQLRILKAGFFFCLYIALIYGVNAGIYNSFKYVFARPRPFVQQNVVLRVSPKIASDLQTNGSLPSGHAVNAFMIAVLLAERFRKKQFAFYGLATLIALSRVYLGVHYPSDIIFGGGLGMAVTGLMLNWQSLKNRITREHITEHRY
jgi:undecaprenyl-diphosphatase